MKAGLRKVTKTVRGKKGSIRRSYWVKSQSVAKAKGSFAAMNHPGPQSGSDHSWLALAVGATKSALHSREDFGTRGHAKDRQNAGWTAAHDMNNERRYGGSESHVLSGAYNVRDPEAARIVGRHRTAELAGAFGVSGSSVRRVFPRKGYNRGSFG